MCFGNDTNKTAASSDRYITPAQVAKILHVSPAHATLLMKSGFIKSVKKDGRWMASLTDIQIHAQERKRMLKANRKAISSRNSDIETQLAKTKNQALRSYLASLEE